MRTEVTNTLLPVAVFDRSLQSNINQKDQCASSRYSSEV